MNCFSFIGTGFPLTAVTSVAFGWQFFLRIIVEFWLERKCILFFIQWKGEEHLSDNSCIGWCQVGWIAGNNCGKDTFIIFKLFKSTLSAAVCACIMRHYPANIECVCFCRSFSFPPLNIN